MPTIGVCEDQEPIRRVLVRALRQAGHEVLTAHDGREALARFTPDQALDVLVMDIGLPDSVAIATDVVDSGNTSAASVPLAIEAMIRHDEAAPGDTALLIAFGAGLSYAGQVVTLPRLA